MNNGRRVHAPEVIRIIEDFAEEGRSYIKTKEIARRSDKVTSGQVRHTMPALEEDGIVSRWSSATPMTWRILI